MQYKSLYLDGVKSEIFKYEGLYHQAAHRNIVEKLKKVKVVSFQTMRIGRIKQYFYLL
jgi:hypothetical protein